MNEMNEELKCKSIEPIVTAFELFDEAKEIQRLVFKLPFAERKSAMEKVYALEKKAVEESRKSIELEDYSISG